MRLIDSEQMENHIMESKVFNQYFKELVQSLIWGENTIEAEPVKHGAWEQKKTAIGKTYSVCNHCETDFKFKTDRGTLARLDMDGMNYCPNCGCKMDKEESK